MTNSFENEMFFPFEEENNLVNDISVLNTTKSENIKENLYCANAKYCVC